MFLIRDARAADLDGLQAVAAHLNSVNLPDDRGRLRALIAASEASFAGRWDVADRRFLFVLTDTETGRVLGSSIIFAQHGSRRSPHVYFDVIEEERYSQTLDRHFVHRILRIGYGYQGVTEIGGLVLLPELRRHPARLGRLLFAVRFAYIAAHRAIFRDEVLSELMPPLEPDGTSLLWEALGRRFTGLSYQEADQLSHENKEFIRALFPEEPIYATLLPPHVQSVIGVVGPDTKGVEAMLRRIGFEYAQRIDPFDGGPHFRARIDDVTLVAATRRGRVGAGGPGPVAASEASPSGAAPPTHAAPTPADAPVPVPVLVLAEGGAAATGGAPLFRAISTNAAWQGDRLLLSEDDRRSISVDAGAEVAWLPLDPSRNQLPGA
ncbi:MAG: arginine N-succinyltransferase [Bacteroidota bacterium]